MNPSSSASDKDKTTDHNLPDWHRLESIEAMSTDELDALPFGAIRLDPEGRIVSYNAAEAEISGRDPDAVIGKDFFKEVAPCTNVQEFAGRFREGVQRGELNVILPYVFDFKMSPTQVWVRLFYSQRSKTAWVFVTRRQEDE